MSENIASVIEKLKSGVVKITFYKGDEKVNSGSGFLCRDRLISNNHVFFDPNGNPLNGTVVGVRFGNTSISEDDVVKMSYEEFMEKLEVGSKEDSFDYAVFNIDKIDYKARHQFDLGTHRDTKEGTQILIMGYPFGENNLTSHVGYVSSIYSDGSVNIIQLDASTNNGNSGGPVIDLETLKVVGIITRKQTGLAKQFDELIESFDFNAGILEKLQGLSWGKLTIGNILSTSQLQMKEIAKNIKRSANVGIGYAFSCNKLREENFYDKKT